MCGIVGIISTNIEEVSFSILKRMTDSISHRGPDGEGQWISQDQNIGFGHRRLSILDLSAAGKQPMHYGDGRYTITFNGEIYNYIELRERLKLKGYKFQSDTDTEVLLALYDFKKEKCLEDVDGMFSFAIWDQKEHTLFCARDRFGEKPFFYCSDYNRFIFASEMKAIWASGVERKVNYSPVFNYLVQNVVESAAHPSETFFSNINKLPPAHYLTIRRGVVEVKRYWNITLGEVTDISEYDAIERFRDIFLTSVTRRLRSDVAVGSSLSGGLDSSTIVCAIDHLLGKKGNKQFTFSARFPNSILDEGNYMQKVIDKTGVTPFFVNSDASVIEDELDKIFYYQEEPFGSASILAQYKVFELARQEKVTVLLDGQGADEFLGGYHTFFKTFFLELSMESSERYQRELVSFNKLYPGHNIYKLGFKDKIWAKYPNIARVFQKFKTTATVRGKNNLSDEFFTSQKYNFESYTHYQMDNLNSRLHYETFDYGLQKLLRYADRNSMAHSIEVRLPFLSHQLVEFMFALPSSFKINSGWTKYLLRKSFEDILPYDIAWRKDKLGYEPPQKEWMASKIMQERIFESRRSLVSHGILDPKILELPVVSSVANEKGDNSWEHLMISLLINGNSEVL